MGEADPGQRPRLVLTESKRGREAAREDRREEEMLACFKHARSAPPASLSWHLSDEASGVPGVLEAPPPPWRPLEGGLCRTLRGSGMPSCTHPSPRLPPATSWHLPEGGRPGCHPSGVGPPTDCHPRASLQALPSSLSPLHCPEGLSGLSFHSREWLPGSCHNPGSAEETGASETHPTGPGSQPAGGWLWITQAEVDT